MQTDASDTVIGNSTVCNFLTENQIVGGIFWKKFRSSGEIGLAVGGSFSINVAGSPSMLVSRWSDRAGLALTMALVYNWATTSCRVTLMDFRLNSSGIQGVTSLRMDNRMTRAKCAFVFDQEADFPNKMFADR